MIKRFAAFLFLMILVTVGSFAIDLSAGFGANLAPYSSTLSASGSYPGGTDSATLKLSYTPFGFQGYFDATYAQLGLGYEVFKTGKMTVSGTGISTTSTDVNVDQTYVMFQGLAKYPFKLGESVAIFPLAGVMYALNLTVTDTTTGTDLKSSMSSQAQSDLNELWLMGGGGVDVAFGRFYLRPEALIGYKIPTQTDKDGVTAVKNSLTSSGYTNVKASITDLIFGITVSFGYIF